MKTLGNVICLECGSENAIVVNEPKYKGFRGICCRCGGNWPES